MFSLAFSLVAVAQALRDFGASSYLVQEKELTNAKIRAAFGITLILAWLLGALMIAVSGPIGQFYQEARIEALVTVVALTFFLLPFSSIVHALLRREMHFAPLMVIHFASAVVQAGVSMALAVLGYGAMSLAWGSVAASVATVLVSYAYRPDLIGLVPSLREARTVLRFAKPMTGATLLSELAIAAPDIIIGRLLGFTANGLFSRAQSLVKMFTKLVNQAISPVALPAFASLYREGKPLAPAHERALVLLSAAAWPFFVFTFLWADIIIDLLLGDQWTEAVPIVRILCIGGAISTLTTFVTPALLAAGYVRFVLKYQLIVQPTAITLIAIGALFSLHVVAFSFVAISVISVAVYYHLARNALSFELLFILQACRKSLFLALGSAIAPLLIDIAAQSWEPPAVVRFALLGTTFSAGWLFLVYILRHPLQHELQPLWQRIRVRFPI